MSFADVYEKYKDEVAYKGTQAPQESPKAPKTSETHEGATSTPPYHSDMGVAALSSYFGVSPTEIRSAGVRQLLQEIYELASSEGEDVEKTLSDIEYRIGEPKMGVSRMEHVHRYLRLSDKARLAYREVKRYEDQGGAGRQEQQDLVGDTTGSTDRADDGEGSEGSTE